MAILINNQTLEIDSVTSILVSAIQPDTNSTAYARRIDFFNTPAGTANAAPVLTIVCYGGNQSTNDQTELQIQTPNLEF